MRSSGLRAVGVAFCVTGLLGLSAQSSDARPPTRWGEPIDGTAVAGPQGAADEGGPSLFGVSATSPTDVWAVGETWPDFQPVMRHFDGSAWVDVPVPMPNEEAALFGVSADTSDDAWAVGYTYDGSAQHNLILHWNGHRWDLAGGAEGNGDSQYLSAVSADSPTDVWAVGQNVAEHWDGTSWTRVAIPPRMTCLGVVALAPDDAWVVGTFGHGSGASTATLHWDGNVLTRVTSPNGPTHYTVFEGVAGTSASDVWAVGAAERGDKAEQILGGERAFAGHWDGTAWIGSSPAVHVPQLVLNSVAATSATQAWAAGNIEYFTPFLLRWNGVRWVKANTPAVSGYAGVSALSADSSDDAWAVGAHYASTGAPSSVLVWHWDGRRWTAMQ